MPLGKEVGIGPDDIVRWGRAYSKDLLIIQTSMRAREREPITGVWERSPQRGFRGHRKAPRGGQGAKPLKPTRFLCLKR